MHSLGCAPLSNFLWHFSQVSSSLACPLMTSPGISSMFACACMGYTNKRLARASMRRIVVIQFVRKSICMHRVHVVDRAEHHHVDQRDVEDMPPREQPLIGVELRRIPESILAWKPALMKLPKPMPEALAYFSAFTRKSSSALSMPGAKLNTDFTSPDCSIPAFSSFTVARRPYSPWCIL